MIKNLIVLVCFGVLFSCSDYQSGKNTSNDSEISENKYSNGFEIRRNKGYSLITVHNPWNPDKAYGRYILLNKNAEIPENLPIHDCIIRTPVSNAVVLSTTHIGMMASLKLENSIIGITDPFRVKNQNVVDNYKKGQIKNVGTSMNADVEQIINAAPEVIIKSGFSDVEIRDKVILNSGIPLLYMVEWQESHPLARAEWIKVLAALYEKDKEADSLYNVIVANYNSLKQKVEHLENKPSVISGYYFKSVWYIPGGKSYIAQFIKDAGGNYLWSADTTTGSMSLGFESVLEVAQNADFWLGVDEKTYERLLENDSRLNTFKPVRLRKVYNYTKTLQEGGGNDYWESGIIRPDVLLSDYIKIFHPDILEDTTTYYFEALR